MKRITAWVLLIAISQVWAFDFDRFAGKKYKMQEAREDVERFSPSNDIDSFKKELVMQLCYFSKYDRALKHLNNALQIVTKLDSEGKKVAADYMLLLSDSNNSLLLEMFNPSDFTYEAVRAFNPFIERFLTIRTDIVIELNDAALMENEMRYLKMFINRLYKSKPEEQIVNELWNKIIGPCGEARKLIYPDTTH